MRLTIHSIDGNSEILGQHYKTVDEAISEIEQRFCISVASHEKTQAGHIIHLEHSSYTFASLTK